MQSAIHFPSKSVSYVDYLYILVYSVLLTIIGMHIRSIKPNLQAVHLNDWHRSNLPSGVGEWTYLLKIQRFPLESTTPLALMTWLSRDWCQFWAAIGRCLDENNASVRVCQGRTLLRLSSLILLSYRPSSLLWVPLNITMRLCQPSIQTTSWV